jgi:hypothetical protein
MALELKNDDDITPIPDSEVVLNGDPETIYQVRHITPKKHAEIVKQNTTRMPNRRTHVPDDVIDWAKVSIALLDYALVDWSGVTSKGQPLPCTLDYKLLLDGPRRSRLLELAGMNEVAAAPEVRAESFPEGAAVR